VEVAEWGKRGTGMKIDTELVDEGKRARQRSGALNPESNEHREEEKLHLKQLRPGGPTEKKTWGWKTGFRLMLRVRSWKWKV